MRVYFMKIQLKIYIILQLIIKNLKNIIKNYFKKFKTYPNEITILTYDAIRFNLLCMEKKWKNKFNK